MDTTILGIAQLAGATRFSPELTEISHRVEAAIRKFDALKPWVVASDLAAGMKATRALIEQVKASSPETAHTDHVLFLLGNKEQEFNDAMHKALGLVMEVLVDPERGRKGRRRSSRGAKLFTWRSRGSGFPDATRDQPQPGEAGERRGRYCSNPRLGNHRENAPGDLPLNNATLRAQFEAKVPDNAATRPYWSRANEWRDHIYQINTPQYLHLPFAPPELLGVFSYEVEGVRFVLSRPVQTVSMDRPWGEQRRLLTVAPAINIAIAPRVGVVPMAAAQPSVNVAVTVSNNVKGDAAGKVKLRLPDGWTATPAEHTFTFTHAGEARNFSFKVSLPRAATGADYKFTPWPNTADALYGGVPGHRAP